MAHVVAARTLGKLFAVALLTTSALMTTARPSLVMAGPIAGNNKVDKYAPPQPNQFVVKVDTALGGDINVINQRYGTTTVEPVAWVDGAYLVRAPDGSDAKQIRDKVDHDKQIAFTEVDALGTPPEADPSSIRAWGMPTPDGYLNQDPANLLGLVQAHQYSRGAGSVVAIIDTGIQLNHPMLAGNLVPGYDFVDNDAMPAEERNGLDDDSDGSIDETYGHGTHIAGIVYLVAPEAKIMPIRVLDTDGNGSVLRIASAIAFAEKNGATVINLSLGAPVESQLLHDVILNATRKGIIVVAAAGNLRPDNHGNTHDERQYPAMDTCVLAVTSLGQANTHSSFSNYGKWVDFAAPGEGIYSAFPDNRYAHWSGTSMATPFIAGQAALLKSLAPYLNAGYVTQLMSETAYDVDALKPNKKYKDRIGVGLVHIGDSVERLASNTWRPSSSKLIDEDCVQPINIPLAAETNQSLTVCELSSAIGANFDGTAISMGRTIWFNAIAEVKGIDKTRTTVVRFENGVINFSANGVNYTLSVPASQITFSPSATAAATAFVNGEWQTTVPASLGNKVFLSGLAFPVPVSLPGGIKPISWFGDFKAGDSGVELNWKWGAGVHTQFTPDYNAVGVKPVEGDKQNPYLNSDHAGTPENYKNAIIGGARGGGDANSGTQSVKCK